MLRMGWYLNSSCLGKMLTPTSSKSALGLQQLAKKKQHSKNTTGKMTALKVGHTLL